jgi:putative lipoic acid-binding regulatory protein
MADVEPPKISFPCDYPLKVVGNAAHDFREFVIETIERHAEITQRELIDVRASSTGRFLSVRITIVATGEEQIQTLYNDLKASGRVHTVL